MKSLDIFLQALEGLKQTLLIPKLTIETQPTFKSFKKYQLEVWEYKDNRTEQIASISITDLSTTEEQDTVIKDALTKRMITEVLKYYGI